MLPLLYSLSELPTKWSKTIIGNKSFLFWHLRIKSSLNKAEDFDNPWLPNPYLCLAEIVLTSFPIYALKSELIFTIAADGIGSFNNFANSNPTN